MKKKSILIVDPDPDHTWHLCMGLTQVGHNVTDTTEPRYALEFLQDQAFEAAIVDVKAARSGDTDLIQPLRRSWSTPLIIAMADGQTMTEHKSVLERGAHYLIRKPVDMDELLSLISPPEGFSCDLEGVDILEYLQFLMLSGKKTVVLVDSPQGHRCTLFLEGRNVVHAALGELQGEAAFFQCVRFMGGRFSNLPWTDPPGRTIERTGEILLWEAAHQRDEQ